MDKNMRQLLSKALQTVSEDDALLVQDPSTIIKIYTTSFLTRYQIYLVQGAYFPLRFYVGFAPHLPVHMLTGQPTNYVALATADHVTIDAPEVAAGYAYVYLEVTRSLNHLFYPVTALEDVKFRVPLNSSQRKMQADFEQKYRAILAPPAAISTNHGYQVIIYAVRDQALELHVINVQPDGGITDQVTTLEQQLPLVYGI